MPEKFYNKFTKKSSASKQKAERKHPKREQNKLSEKVRESSPSSGADLSNFYDAAKKIKRKKNAKIISIQKMFDSTKLTKESRNVLENFDTIVQGVRPLNSRQFVQLPKDIRNLSHRLTDEREERRMGYTQTRNFPLMCDIFHGGIWSGLQGFFRICRKTHLI